MQLLKKILTIPFAAAFLLLLIAGHFNTSLGEPTKVIKLPEPDRTGSMPLETTLQKRRSVRHFRDTPLSLGSASQLLWSAQGITDKRGFRTAPSAGALYPLEIYLVAGNVDGLEKGIYLYKPTDHSLAFTSQVDCLQKLSRAALRQGSIKQAPAVFVIVGKQERTTVKYGRRGVRYMYMESGHAAQNISLQAVALGLDSVTIGAFNDYEVAEILKIGKNAEPLYIIPVGKAK